MKEMYVNIREALVSLRGGVRTDFHDAWVTCRGLVGSMEI